MTYGLTQSEKEIARKLRREAYGEFHLGRHTLFAFGIFSCSLFIAKITGTI